jgi:D-alanyl-D-alanine carboxypeptidase/D-alanyl-D-alanine-endopeptidase (penicillin-binding protein 4)
MFKLAGGKYLGLETGTDTAGIKMFNDYCVRNNLDNSRIRITDGSGVSKNNLVSADFVTNFLGVNKDNKIMDSLPKPGEGTLIHRMLPIKDNLRAKTGTLSDVSAIAGYLTSKSGKKYTFCIMTNDMKLSESDKKMLEDFIIREAYLRL